MFFDTRLEYTQNIFLLKIVIWDLLLWSAEALNLKRSDSTWEPGNARMIEKL